MTSSPRPGGIVAVLATAGIVAALTQTLVVPIIGELPHILNTSASNASWVITVALLAGAVSTPIVGRLGDMYGKYRMLLLSTVPLILGSMVCALSSTLIPMIIGRGMQGLSVGIIPLGISLMRDVVPAERLGSAIAVMGSSLGVGGALGLPAAAAVAQNVSWRALFWATAVLAALAAGLIWLAVPAPVTQERADTGRSRFDFLGAIGLGAGLIALLLAVSKGAVWGWGSGTVVGLLVAAVAILAGWGWWELRLKQPLVDLRVTARPQVLLTNMASIVVGFGMYAQALIMPQLLQLPAATGYGLGQSMLAMGLWMAPAGVMMMLASPVSAKLSAVRGPKTTLMVGGAIVSAGYALATVLMGSTWGLLIASCVANIGVGLAYGSMPALIMGAVPQSETAAANSFNTLMRAIGTTVSAAIVGVVLSQMTIDLGGHILPSENGFRVGLWIGSLAALLAAAIASAIPTPRPAPEREPDMALASVGVAESRR